MGEVLIEFENVLRGVDDRAYVARACGRARPDGLWEGWLEFSSGERVVRSGRETTQPNRDLLRYWAGGLTAPYLDGALLRALRELPHVTPPTSSAVPAFDGPAETGHAPPAGPEVPPAHAVLDPFAVYASGEHVLHGQLEALDEGQLRNIIRAYGLEGHPATPVAAMNRYELAHHILAAVRARGGR